VAAAPAQPSPSPPSAVEACVMLLAAIVCVRSKCDVDVRVGLALAQAVVQAMVAAVCPARKHRRVVVQALTADVGARPFAIVYVCLCCVWACECVACRQPPYAAAKVPMCRKPPPAVAPNGCPSNTEP
jgi:hypothetical protein